MWSDTIQMSNSHSILSAIANLLTFGILSSIIISRWHGLARSPLVIASEFDSYCLLNAINRCQSEAHLFNLCNYI